MAHPTWILLPFSLVLFGLNSGVFGYRVNLVVVNREALSEEITCWTCPNKTDNEACNNWAPDISCPFGHGWCRTVHRVNMNTGGSVFVDKQCVMPEQCEENVVGCHETGLEGVLDCITCCNRDYCNEHVPSNHSAAFQLSSYYDIHNSAESFLRIHYVCLLTGLFLFITLTSLS